MIPSAKYNMNITPLRGAKENNLFKSTNFLMKYTARRICILHIIYMAIVFYQTNLKLPVFT